MDLPPKHSKTISNDAEQVIFTNEELDKIAISMKMHNENKHQHNNKKSKSKKQNKNNETDNKLNVKRKSKTNASKISKLRISSKKDYNVGDFVLLSKNREGIIGYKGKLHNNPDNITFYGIELLNGSIGDSDGKYLGKQYFNTLPDRAVFVQIDEIRRIMIGKDYNTPHRLDRRLSLQNRRASGEANKKQFDFELAMYDFAKTIEEKEEEETDEMEDEKKKRQINYNKVPRKLGPRDIGRSNYKGTKYKHKSTGHWLDEKLHKHARTNSFNVRKSRNPVKRRQTVEQIGSPTHWQKPAFYHKEVQKMNQKMHKKTKTWNGFFEALLDDKPIHTKHGRFDALKNQKIPKGMAVKQYGKPKGWKEIQYEYKHDEQNGFLDEKFWFDASKVQFDGDLTKLIDALPSDKKLQLIEGYHLTGYQSKVNFLKRLRDIVMSEIERLRKEDQILRKIESKRVLSIVEDEKYKMLSKQKSSTLGVLQRKLFTVKSVGKLTNLIDAV